jgi:hypothetical protein
LPGWLARLLGDLELAAARAKCSAAVGTSSSTHPLWPELYRMPGRKRFVGLRRAATGDYTDTLRGLLNGL